MRKIRECKGVIWIDAETNDCGFGSLTEAEENEIES
jgi:hypothetical protein